MPRKKLIKKSLTKSDFKYKNILVALLINKFLKHGKKSLAKRIIYKTFIYISTKSSKNPLFIFEKAIKNISPRIKLKINRVGGATYQVPILLNIFNGINFAIRWLLQISKKRSEKQMYLKLGNEILDSAKGNSLSIKKKEEIYKIAKANQAFLDQE